jgi:farnesyl-diphosphate farnesyltransferase
MTDVVTSAFAFVQTYFAYIAGVVVTAYLLQRHNKAKKSELLEKNKKQGGYGKIPMFQKKTTIRSLLADPKALQAVVMYKTGCGLPGVKKGKIPAPPDFAASKTAQIDADIVFCGVMLDKVSRSFAAVIRQLPVTLALPVCIFYLVLRALDTVEDDMDLTKFAAALKAAKASRRGGKGGGGVGDDEESEASAREFKFQCLAYFHTLLRDTATAEDGVKAGFYDADVLFRTLSDANVGEKDEATLFKKFDSVVRVYAGFAPTQRAIIADITKQMADGMAAYIGRDLSDKGTEDLRDYSTYCHYVAGLVGEGLSRMWATAADSGLPRSTLQRLSAERGQHTLSSDMGLFLQKTNIIRDYLEDIVDQRAFWPKEVWGQYVERLGDLKESGARADAVACLNHLVCDALEMVPSCLAYLRLLEAGSVQVLRFCAIPQVMAIATLCELYGNPLVFQGVVKISKPTAVRIVVETGSMEGIETWCLACAKEMRAKLAAWRAAPKELYQPAKSDAVARRTEFLLGEIDRLCRAR